MEKNIQKRGFFFLLLFLSLLSACKKNENLILIDGSSTVYPITEAVSEEFLKNNPSVTIAIGESGTGGGFAKFKRGEIDINNASRPITDEEIEECLANNIQFFELPVAFDGIAVVVHSTNNWVRSMTVAELKKIWEPAAQGKIMRWNQIRSEWPDEEIHLFGAGVSSGTFDYFTEVIVGKKKASRGDYTASEDDNVLVQGVSQDVYALGYFGLAYYEENRSKLKAVAIDDLNSKNGDGPVFPEFENVANSTYQPLIRPEFIYVTLAAATKPAVSEFVNYYLTKSADLVKEVGYIPLSDDSYKTVLERFNRKVTGSLIDGKEIAEVDLMKLLYESTK